MKTTITTSRRIRAIDFRQEWFKARAQEMCLDPNRMHRKIWEFSIVAQTYKEDLTSDRPLWWQWRFASSMGFGCGRDPIPAWLASQLSMVIVSDSPTDSAKWTESEQRIVSASQVPYNGICSATEHMRFISFRPVDMNNIPDDLLRGKFDFTWSCGSMEHIGGIDQSIQFFCNQMKCLRPGGIAAHTTEFNPFGIDGPDGTLNDRNLCLLRERDLILLRDRLESQGDRLFPLDLSPGDLPEDMIVDKEPYTGDVHLSIKVGKWTTTSVLLVAQKG